MPGVQCTRWSQKAAGRWSHSGRGATRAAGRRGLPRIIRPHPKDMQTLEPHDYRRRGAWRPPPRSRAVFETLQSAQ